MMCWKAERFMITSLCQLFLYFIALALSVFTCLSHCNMSTASTTCIIRSTSSALAFAALSTSTTLGRTSRSVPRCYKRRPRRGLSVFTSSFSSSSFKFSTATSPQTTRMTVSMPPTSALTSTDPSVSGPEWVLEYTELDAPELLGDIAMAETLTTKVATIGDKIKDLLPTARNLNIDSLERDGIRELVTSMTKEYWQAAVLLRNVATQAGCVASCDGMNEKAKKLSASMQVKFSKLSQAYEPASLFLDLCPDDVFDAIIVSSDDEELKAAEYMFRHSRKMREHKLSLDEENILTKMRVTGHSAWGTLYTDLSVAIGVKVNMPDGTVKEMGIASADAMRDDKDPLVRKAAWEGIREAWVPHQETCAAVLNAITGWRADIYEKRGLESFLASSLHQNRMSDATLRALLEAIDGAGVDVGRKALSVQAKSLGCKDLKPWDLYAPAPVSNKTERIYTFDEGIELIANAVSEVDEEAGVFVRMMRDNKWIEASRGDTKRPGAYCTGFSVSRTPRVYLSDYNGGAALLLTLAHELGHAYHSWVMKDLALAQLSYPMNLAETASIFFETVVGNKLVEQAASPEERFGMLWGEAESASAFFLNIPARYRFEEELNERRKVSGPLSTGEIDDIMVRAWKRYYGPTLAAEEIERVGVFSQSKLHFYLTGISFYNWPYSFGYLFALGVYARFQKVGKEGTNGVPFAQVYRDLLRDTGRMDAEGVVKKHLGADIEDAQFWKDAIGVAEAKVDLLEKVAVEIGKA